MIQLISFLVRENDVKFPNFKYWIWTKVQPITPSRRSGSAQRLAVCVPRTGDFTAVVLVFLTLWAWSTWLMVRVQRWDCWCSLSCGSKVSLELWLGIGVKARGIPWVVARVGECCRCGCAGCGQYGWVQIDCPPQ